MPWFRRRRENELEEEIGSHLRMAVDDRMSRGQARDDAQNAALAEFGNQVLIREVTREMWGWASLDRLAQDVRGALRMLRRDPGFAAVVVLTLALGIGANTAIYSVMHAALTPLAIAEPERVVMVWTENLKRDWHQFPASVPDFEDWKASGVFQHLGAMTDRGVNIRIGDRTERVSALNVTDGLFDALAVKCQLGRTFRADDMRSGGGVVVLTDAMWRARFAADPAIVGRSIIVDGTPHIVIGVLPQSFPKFEAAEIFTPLLFQPDQITKRGERFFGVVGRLRPGLSLEAAQARMTALSLNLARRYTEDTGSTVRLQPANDAMVQDTRTLLLVLFGAVGFLLLIACANIANLLLARGTARGKELAIRTALGAGRWRLSRQLLTESVVLALAGGLLGLAPAIWAIRFVTSFHIEELHNADSIALNGPVLAFNFAVALVTGLVFGLIPALQAWRADVNSTLKAAARSYTSGLQQRLRSVFVVSELAFTLVLLVAAGLMVQSFLRLRASNPGYDPRGVLTLRTEVSDAKYATPEKQSAFFEDLLNRAHALPGVVHAGAIDDLPTSDTFHGSGLFFPGRPEPRSEDVPIAVTDSIGPDYLRALRIPLLRGRFFNDADGKNTTAVALVDEFLARRYFPGEDAVGKSIKLGRRAKPLQIVGVVGNVNQNVLVRIMKGQVPQVYVPFLQAPKPAMALVLRTSGDPAALVPAMREIIRRVDINQPLFHIQTMEEALSANRTTQRLATLLLGGFSITALLLATIGIYGVIAYSVGQRMREFGIRISLGAQKQDVLGLVLRQALVLAAIAGVIGLAGALALTRLMSGLLYGVRATDPLTFTAVTALLLATALLASYIPARRATRVDPMRALHYE